MRIVFIERRLQDYNRIEKNVTEKIKAISSFSKKHTEIQETMIKSHV